MLHLVGANQGSKAPVAQITARRAHYEANQLERLVRLHRGVYCDEDDLQDLSGFMRRSALRIANYLYRGASLTHSSAHFKGAVEQDDSTPENPRYKLFLAGSYRHRVKLQYLEIVQTEGLQSGRIGQFCQPVVDEQDRLYGPLYLSCLNDEVSYLQQFSRKRYHLERFISPTQLDRLRDMLLDRHGEALLGRLRTVAAEVGDMGGELDSATSHLNDHKRSERLGDRITRIQKGTPVPLVSAEAINSIATGVTDDQEEGAMNNIFEFDVGWYQKPIGRIVNNGVAWNFSYDEGWMLPLTFGKVRPGVMPAFITNLFPEGFLQEAMNTRLGTGRGMNTGVIANSERYLSNIAIVSNRERLKKIPIDALNGRLKDCIDENAVFNGTQKGMPSTDPEFINELNKVLTDIGMPRFSGHAPKVPTYIDENHVLSPAQDVPFTHITKLPGLTKDPYSLRGVVEWASMSLARGGGVVTCDFAMLEMENGTLGYMCERFDVPESEDDMRMLYAEDFCAVFTMGGVLKYALDEGIETLIDGYKKNATPSKHGDDQMFRQIYANYILENADFHAKNASLVRVASRTLDSFRKTELAPAYDIMNTRYFRDFPLPSNVREPMALGLRGKETGYDLEDFKLIGDRIGLTHERVEELMWETAHGIAEKATQMAGNLPSLLDSRSRAKHVVQDMLVRAVNFCREDFADIPALQIQALLQPAETGPMDHEREGESSMIRDVRKALKMS